MIKSKYDLNRYKKVYPLLRTKPVYDEIVMLGGIKTEVAIIDFVDSYVETYTFVETYTQVPVIGATVEDENVNVFVTNINTTSVTVQSSAPFTGKVHLQIFDSDN